MKKTMIILITIIFASTVNAQWYSQYGVTNMNELNQVQLNMAFDQGVKLQKGGVITTIISSAMLIVGSVMYSNGINNIVSSTTYTQIDNGVSKGTNGALLLYGGGIGLCVGVPIWIVGAQRMNAVKVHLVKFDQLGGVQYGIGVNLIF